MDSNGKKCCCPCHKMIGIFVILFGLTFLLKNLGVISDHTAAIAWPVIIILAGLKRMAKSMCKCCPEASKTTD